MGFARPILTCALTCVRRFNSAAQSAEQVVVGVGESNVFPQIGWAFGFVCILGKNDCLQIPQIVLFHAKRRQSAGLANLARAGQNPMGLIQQLGGQSAPIMQGLNLIQGKNEAQLKTMAQNLAKERGIDLNQLASVLNLTLPR